MGRSAIGAAVLAVLLPVFAWESGGASPAGGTISGTVRDSRTGGNIPGARVSLGLGLETRTAITDSAGAFTISGVPVGDNFPLRAEKDGFRSETVKISVSVGQTALAAIRLTDTYLKLLSFHGGRYIAGTERQVRWEAVGIGILRIEFSPNGGRTWILLDGAVDARRGSWPWEAPDIPTDTGIIRISDSNRPDFSDRSEQPFSLTST